MEWQAAIAEKLERRGAAAIRQELPLDSPQGPEITSGENRMINMSSNNYLALANHPEIKAAVAAALDEFGFGLSSVRFLSGTHRLHVELEQRTSALMGAEATVLFGSCFDANAGVFEALLDENDRIISDELNHASIIDGVRLSRAARIRMRHGDLDDLEGHLRKPLTGGMTLIVTDGVFSMDGTMAPLAEMSALAKKYGAMLMVDDSHGIGATGSTGRGVAERFNLLGQVDIITGTFGKALGGAVGGFATGRADVISLLRSARPYLFSNPIPPHIAAGAMKAIEIMLREPNRVAALQENARTLRMMLERHEIDVLPGEHAIVPVILRSTEATHEFVSQARKSGVWVAGITYPVVPRGKERVRLQVSAGHSREQLERVAEVAATCFQGSMERSAL